MDYLDSLMCSQHLFLLHDALHLDAMVSSTYNLFFLYYREDFHYDNGNKTGKAVLRGASGATRDGTKKNGNWHGPATFTSQDGEVKDERWDNGRKL